MKPIKVSLIYKDIPRVRSPYYRPGGFTEGLDNCDRLQVKHIIADNEYDINKLPETDIILLLDDYTNITPNNLIGIKKTSTPVFCRTGDIHDYKTHNRFQYKEKYNIDCYFNSQPKGVFYKYYPKDWTYRMVVYGLRSHLYQTLDTTFKGRVKDRILLTGAIPTRNLIKRCARRFLKRTKKGYRFVYSPHTTYYYYALRAKCRSLSYVDFKYDKCLTKYPSMLAGHRAHIAATTLFPTTKYLESAAAKCLTFMEINDRNCGKEWGFKDGENRFCSQIGI